MVWFFLLVKIGRSYGELLFCAYFRLCGKREIEGDLRMSRCLSKV